MGLTLVAIGSALGGLMRYGITVLLQPWSARFPVATLLINVLGSFIIGLFAAATSASERFPASLNLRLFVMVGLCGGFTTFSSFSLQTFDLLRSGASGRALANVVLSVLLCLLATAAGFALAARGEAVP